MSGEGLRPRVGIGVFVFKDDKFLVQKRTGAHGEGTWSLPGGHLEYGESFAETASREVMEETGLTIAGVDFAAVTNDIFPEEQKHYVTVWMQAEWAAGEPVITEPDKCTEQRWVDFDTLPEPLFLPWKQLLESTFIDELKTR